MAVVRDDMASTIADSVEEVEPMHLWANISLNDFRAANCFTGVSYAYFWVLVFVNVAVMAADAYTGVVLLAFNRWPGQITPAIPFDVSRWIFAACILLSWILVAYHIFRAFRVIRRGSVAKDYLDPLAATYQSMRSWRRFLVFAELTKSKKGVDYVALFSYFQFQGAVQTLLAEGPRQAINAITLWSAMKADLMNGTATGTAALSQLAGNIHILATTQPAHAAILFTMFFSLVIWVIRALSLIFAAMCYIGFLVHYIQGFNLARYCKTKIEKRMERIVVSTSEKYHAKLESRRRRAEERAARGDRGFLRRKRSDRSTSSTTQLMPAASPALPDVEKDDSGELSAILRRHPSEKSTHSSAAIQDLPSNPLFVPRPPPMRVRRLASEKRGVAREPGLATIAASPRTSPIPFSNDSMSSQDSFSSQHRLIRAPEPLNIPRKPIPNLRGAVPVNPHPPPTRAMPPRPTSAHGRRPDDAAAVPVPQAAPHTRSAGGLGGPTTFAAMGL